MTHRVLVATSAALLVGCRNDGVIAQHVVAGGRPARGIAAIHEYGCGSCHVIPGVRGAVGKVGPPLSDFARRTFIAGRLPNRPDHLVQWIRNAPAVDPGTAMPNLGVSDGEARDIASYLYTLGGDATLGPSHPLPTAWLRALEGGH